MRKPLNLEVMTLEKFNFLLHGDYASGKTALLADFLVTEKARGSVRLWNMAGEDGYMTALGWGMDPTDGETLETYEDVDEAINEATKKPFHALAIDGLKSMAEMVIVHEVGSDRMPTIQRGGEGVSQKNEWSEVNWAATRLYRRLRHCADIVFVAVNSDKNPNPLADAKKLFIGPDLPGKQARDIGPWDLVGYLRADPIGPGRLRRVVTFTPNAEVVVRQRLKRAIVAPIILPEGPGGWKMLYDTFKLAMDLGEKQ